MSAPRVSVIVTSFNKGSYIGATIECLLAQTFSEWEAVIVDDGSTDNSVELIHSYIGKDKRIRLFINDTNRGANFSRNKGIHEASGAYIVFLDGDDLLSPTCIESRYKLLEEKGFPDFLVFPMRAFRLEIGDAPYEWIPRSRFPLRDFLRHKLPWTISQPIWKRDFLLSLKGFDENFQRLQDVELHTRALLVSGVRFELIRGEPDCYYRVEEGRLNFAKFALLSRYVDSALLFFRKFEAEAKARGLYPKLFGTLYAVYQMLLYNRRIGAISRQEFTRLERRLLNSEINVPKLKRIWFRTGERAASLPVHIPGVNKIMSLLLEL